MGTPSFAVQPLLSLINNNYEIIACITQPDRKRGRGNKVTFSDVKKVALENNILVLQPDNIKKSTWVETIKKLNPNLFITCAYGQILSKAILDIPKYGCINIHASLLPKYRGASPIARAIINGDKKTGVTTMLTDVGMDTGDILLKKELDIPIDMTVSDLHNQLSILGSKLIIETLNKLSENKLTPIKQNDKEASYAPMLKKEDGIINWNEDSITIYNKIRGLNPWPGCYTTLLNKRLKIIAASFEEEVEAFKAPGTIIESSKIKISVACKKGVLNILKLKFDNKKEMDVSMCYHNIKSGSVFK